MTRRNKSRLPPKLADPIREQRPPSTRLPSLRDQLKDARVSGRSAEFGSDAVTGIMRRVARNETRALLGCPPFAGLRYEHVAAAVESVYGWTGDGPRARIAPQRTIDGFAAACTRVIEVSGGGGRLVFATARPASLLFLHRALAEAATACGGAVLSAVESAPLDSSATRPGARRLWWLDRVAVVTDGRSLMGDEGAHTGVAEELLFSVGRPDLVVADRYFAGAAVAAGLEVIAFAGLDALPLAVAAWRGMAIRVVPLDELRPPQAYLPLVTVLETARAATARI